MSDKSTWPTVAFGDVVKLNTDRIADPVAEGIERYVGIEHIEPEDLRIRSWGQVAEGTTFTNYFQPGQVLFVKRRAYQRKVAVADFSGVCSGDIYVLESKDPDVLLPELLPFLCQTERFFEHAVGTSAGSLSPRTNWTRLSAYEFALPPLAEQRRIADLLWAVEDKLESLRELSIATEMLGEATVEHLLASEITTNIPLSEKADISYGLTVNRTRREDPWRVPYLRVANILRGQVNLEDVKDIGFVNGDEQYLLQMNDILVVEGHANPEEIGRAAIWKCEIERCAHQNHLIRVRCKEDLDPEFLLIVLNSTVGRKHFLSYCKSTSGLNTINSKVVRDVSIPFTPLSQQQQIVSKVAEVRSSRNEIRARLDSTEEVKARILAELSRR